LTIAVCAAAHIAAPAAARAERDPAFETHYEESNKAHFVAARYDWGKRGSTYGVGYFHAWEFGASNDGLGMFGWFGPGVELRVATADHDAVDGMVVAVPLRWSMVADGGTAGGEISAGISTMGGTRGVFTLGAFLGFYYADVGYSYQFGVGGDRPDWLASHQFSLRVQLPVHRYDRREKTERRPRPRAEAAADHSDGLRR